MCLSNTKPRATKLKKNNVNEVEMSIYCVRSVREFLQW